MIDRLHDSNCPGAMGTAIERAVRLDAVSDDLAVAMVANRRQLLHGTLEAVERVRHAGSDHLERKMVVVPITLRTWP